MVFETGYTVTAVADAAAAATPRSRVGALRSSADRWAVPRELQGRDRRARADGLADAIVLETGKIRSEAKPEIQTLLNRFDLVKGAMAADLKPGQVAPGEHAPATRRSAWSA